MQLKYSRMKRSKYMEDLKLELDEGIILQTTDVERYQKNDNYLNINNFTFN